jgi:hypothetical protein
MHNAISDAGLTAYHCIPLEQVVFDLIVADPKYTNDDTDCSSYTWLAGQVGFYPIFVALGNKDIIGMTRYHCQFSKPGPKWEYRIGENKPVRIVAEKPRLSFNYVLFEFPLSALSDRVVFTDYSYWCTINGDFADTERNPVSVKRTFKRSWSRRRWLEYASAPGWNWNVQPIVPVLDLRLCKRVWVRNERTRNKVERMGFQNIGIKRRGY